LRDGRDGRAYGGRYRVPLEMPMLDLDAADVETVARPAASPNTKAAIAYAIAAGTTAISVIETETGRALFRVGSKIDPDATAIYWIAGQAAIAVARRARRLAGANPHCDEAIAALRQAAAEKRSTLTPHDVAISRAGAAAQRLDEYMASVRGTGVLREFNRAYKRRRMAATARGEGFMTFKTAEARLRNALVPLLQGNGNVHTATIFADIFGES
jgi:hypothetical protein